MNLKHILYALEVFRSTSFSQAAKNLYTSQPAISNAIAELEDSLGFEIFERTNKGVTPTARGLDFLIQCQPLEAKYLEIIDTYDLSDDPRTLELRVSSQHFNFVVAAFVNIIKLYTGTPYRFYLKETKSLEAIGHVEDGSSELAFIYINQTYQRSVFNLLDEKGLVFSQIANVKPHVFLASDHPLARLDAITLDKLTPYPMVVYEQGGTSILPEEFVDLPDHDQVIYSQDRGTALSIIRNTQAFNIGTGYTSPTITSPDIVSIELAHAEGGSMDIGYIHKKDWVPSDICLEFIDLTIREIS